MTRSTCKLRQDGSSLVELMIAVMLLGIGMVMVAGAFPVGLGYHEQAVDETVAGLLSRTAVSRLTMLRTRDQYTRPRPAEGDPDWGGQERKDGGYRDFWGQMSVVECFGNTTELQWLFDAGRHSGGSLSTQQLGGNNHYPGAPGDDFFVFPNAAPSPRRQPFTSFLFYNRKLYLQ